MWSISMCFHRLSRYLYVVFVWQFLCELIHFLCENVCIYVVYFRLHITCTLLGIYFASISQKVVIMHIEFTCYCVFCIEMGLFSA